MGYDYSYYDRIWGYDIPASTKFFAFILAVLQIVVWWRLFEKAGEAGWKSIIPIYNLWTTFKIANSFKPPIGWFIAMIIPGINVIVGAIMRWRFASRYTDSFGLRLLYFIFPFIGGLIFAFNDEFVYRPEGVNVYYR